MSPEVAKVLMQADQNTMTSMGPLAVITKGMMQVEPRVHPKIINVVTIDENMEPYNSVRVINGGSGHSVEEVSAKAGVQTVETAGIYNGEGMV